MAGRRDPFVRLWLDGVPVDGVERWLLQAEVEERCDDATTFRLVLDMSPIGDGTSPGDWDLLEHGAVAADAGVPDVGLLRRVTVAFGLTGGEAARPDVETVVVDGYATAVEAVIGPSRVPDSSLVLTGSDALCLMHLSAATHEWFDVTDADVARQLFTRYGFGVGADSIEATAPTRARDRGSIVQRGTDAELLRRLAQRNGYEWHLEPGTGAVTPGTHPSTGVTGHFHAPRPQGPAQPDLELFPRDDPVVIEMRARWDAEQATRWRGWHIDEVTRRLLTADVTDPGYPRMGAVSREQAVAQRLGAIRPVRSGAAVLAGGGSGGDTQLLEVAATDVPDDATELTSLARAAYRGSDWFAVARATVRGERYPQILRSRRPVGLSGAGHLLDGTWYVRSVRHRWGVDPEDPEAEQVTTRYEADAVLVRNALGGQP
jgi:hypothetical protein